MIIISKRLLVYVIGAYSGNIEENIEKAENVSISLIRNGYHVITPHKNTAGYEKYQNNLLAPGLYITYQTWIEMDLNIMSRCDAVYVMDNVSESNGSKIEIEYAKKLGLKFLDKEDGICL